MGDHSLFLLYNRENGIVKGKGELHGKYRDHGAERAYGSFDRSCCCKEK